MSRKAILRLTDELLVSILGLPKDTRIVDARKVFDGDGIVELVIEHGDLKEVRPGSNYEVVFPKLSIEHELGMQQGFVVPRKIKFEGWGQ